LKLNSAKFDYRKKLNRAVQWDRVPGMTRANSETERIWIQYEAINSHKTKINTEKIKRTRFQN